MGLFDFGIGFLCNELSSSSHALADAMRLTRKVMWNAEEQGVDAEANMAPTSNDFFYPPLKRTISGL